MWSSMVCWSEIMHHPFPPAPRKWIMSGRFLFKGGSCPGTGNQLEFTCQWPRPPYIYILKEQQATTNKQKSNYWRLLELLQTVFCYNIKLIIFIGYPDSVMCTKGLWVESILWVVSQNFDCQIQLIAADGPLAVCSLCALKIYTLLYTVFVL